jgi:nicotinate phosphoribosyltransferase
VGGTHAHSWVLSFDSELESFEAYARAMPNNCVFLVDTYNTLEGVRHAVQVGCWLREQGREMLGVRLDSGDLAYLSKEARRILDEGGFPEAKVYASSELDEHLVESLKIQGAKIAVWGVGTNLVTAKDDPALGGVYKLTAVRQPGEPWDYKVKLSEQAVKITTPGIQQVRRFSTGGEFMADMIFDEELGAPSAPTIVDPGDLTRRKEISGGTEHADLLVPIFRQGLRVYDPPPLKEVRQRTAEQLAGFHGGVKRFANPHQYPVGLERGLFDLKTRLILQARGLEKET